MQHLLYAMRLARVYALTRHLFEMQERSFVQALLARQRHSADGRAGEQQVQILSKMKP